MGDRILDRNPTAANLDHDPGYGAILEATRGEGVALNLILARGHLKVVDPDRRGGSMAARA